MSADFDYCVHCGDSLPADEWCPVVTDRDGDGEVVVHSFCDDDCRDAWLDERDADES